MVNGVKCSAKIKQNKIYTLSRIKGKKNVISYFHKGCFSAVICFEGQIAEVHVNYFLRDGLPFVLLLLFRYTFQDKADLIQVYSS